MNDTTTIPNIHECRIEFVRTDTGYNCVITRIIPYSNETELFTKDIYGSKITVCKLNNENVDIKMYSRLFVYLYTLMTENERQLYMLDPARKNNIQQGHVVGRGFIYHPVLGISIQNASAPVALAEIIRIAKLKRSTFEIHITLKNDEIVRFRI
jgi:hypothetical protein